MRDAAAPRFTLGREDENCLVAKKEIRGHFGKSGNGDSARNGSGTEPRYRAAGADFIAARSSASALALQ